MSAQEARQEPSSSSSSSDGATLAARTIEEPSTATTTTIDDNAGGTANNIESTKSKELEGVMAGPAPPVVPPPLFVERKRDFWVIPIPTNMRYHPDRPFHFSLATNYLFAFVGHLLHHWRLTA